MRKATIIVIAAIYVASIVIVGVFGLRAENFKQTVFIDDIIMPATIGGQPVDKSEDGKNYSVTLTYSNGLEVLIDYDTSPASEELVGKVNVTIITEIGYDRPEQGEKVAVIDESNGCTLKIYQRGFIQVRLESTDGKKVSKTLTVLVL